MPPTDHARLSPSAAHRWLNCPAAPRLEARYPQTSSSYADEGRAAHELAERYLHMMKSGFPLEDTLRFLQGAAETEKTVDISDDGENARSIPITEEMIAGVTLYLQTIDGLKKGARILVEQKLDLSDLGKDIYGTADCIIAKPWDVLTVVDYKNGVQPVRVDHNPQLLLYAYGAWQLLKDQEFESVRLVVVQPNLIDGDPVSSCTITVEDLLKWIESIAKPAVKAASRRSAAPVAGTWCRWCRHAAECPALIERAATTAMTVFDPADPSKRPAASPPSPDSLTPTQLGQVMDFAITLKTWLAAVQARIVQLLQEGASAEELGWKMVAGRATRKWSDESAVEKAMFDAGLNPYRKVLLSPAQAEKALKAARKDKTCEETALAVCELTLEDLENTVRGSSLVPITDKRPAIQPAQIAFSPVSAEEE